MLGRILRAIERAESIENLHLEIKKLSSGLDELANAMKALATVVNQHNTAIRATSEENEYILSILKEDLSDRSVDLVPIKNSNKEKPN